MRFSFTIERERNARLWLIGSCKNEDLTPMTVSK